MGKSNKIAFNKKTHNKILEITEKYDIKFSDFINDAVKYYIKEGKYLDKVRKKKLKKNSKDPEGALNKFISENFEYGVEYYVPMKVMYKMLYDEGIVEKYETFKNWVKNHKELSNGFPVICGKRIQVVKGIRIKIDPEYQKSN